MIHAASSDGQGPALEWSAVAPGLRATPLEDQSARLAIVFRKAQNRTDDIGTKTQMACTLNSNQSRAHLALALLSIFPSIRRPGPLDRSNKSNSISFFELYLNYMEFRRGFDPNKSTRRGTMFGLSVRSLPGPNKERACKSNISLS